MVAFCYLFSLWSWRKMPQKIEFYADIFKKDSPFLRDGGHHPSLFSVQKCTGKFFIVDIISLPVLHYPLH